MSSDESSDAKVIRAGMSEGLDGPEVEIGEGDAVWIEVGEGADVEGFAVKPFESKVGVSLRSLKVDLHNQSYGVISASTGCISNVGGPSC